MAIRDRIVELRRVRAPELRANRKNWRRHPEAQARALRSVLEQVGYADALLARETADGLELIDGHLRAETTPEDEVPVLILDAEADRLLATRTYGGLSRPFSGGPFLAGVSSRSRAAPSESQSSAIETDARAAGVSPNSWA